MNTLRVLLADDHTLVRAGVRILLQNIAGIEVVGEASEGREILDLVKLHQPDILLTDLAMPGLNGLEAIARLKREAPALQIVVLSMHTNEEYVREALTLGAQGYLVKGADPAELELALKAVNRGEVYLSPAVSKSVVSGFLDTNIHDPNPAKKLTFRQREILQLIAEGKTSKDIAKILDLSAKTIESHRTELMNRLNIHDVAGLVRYAIRRGVISADN